MRYKVADTINGLSVEELECFNLTVSGTSDIEGYAVHPLIESQETILKDDGSKEEKYRYRIIHVDENEEIIETEYSEIVIWYDESTKTCHIEEYLEESV